MPTYTIEGTAEFHDSSVNQATITEGIFFDSSKNDTGGQVDIALFQDTTENKGTIKTVAIFDDQSSNAIGSTIESSASVIFKGDSDNYGTVTAATFIDAATNANGATVTNARFADTSSNAGTVSNAVFVSSQTSNTGNITTSLQKPYDLNLGGSTSGAQQGTYAQTSGAFSYGYFNESGTSAAPANYTTTAYAAQDAANIYYMYAIDGGVIGLANGNYIEGGTSLKRVFANGVKTNVSIVTLNSTDYYYSGSLATGSTTLYTTKYLVTKASAASGTDTISGTNSSWTISSQGVLTFSAAASYQSKAIGGATYYFAGGVPFTENGTVLYTNTSLTNVAGANGEITGSVDTGNSDQSVRWIRWIINTDGTYDETYVFPYTRQVNGNTEFLYATLSSLTVGSSISVFDDSGSAITTNLLIRNSQGNTYQIQSGSISRQVFHTGLYEYYSDNASFDSTTEIIDQYGTILTSLDPIIASHPSGTGLIRLTVTNSVVAIQAVNSVSVGSVSYVAEDLTNITYDSTTGQEVSNIAAAVTNGNSINSVDSSGLFVSIPVRTETLNSITYYIDNLNNAYDSNAQTVTTAGPNIWTNNNQETYRQLISSGVYSSTRVYSIQDESQSATFYMDQSAITSAAEIYSDSGEEFTNLIVTNNNGDLHRVDVNSGIISSVEQIWSVTLGYKEYSTDNTGKPTNNQGYINGYDAGATTKIFDGSLTQITNAYIGFFLINNNIAHTFSVSNGVLTIGLAASYITDIKDEKHFVQSSTFTTGLTTFDIFGVTYAPPFISVDGSNNFVRWIPNQPSGGSSYTSYETVYQVSLEGNTYYSNINSSTLVNGTYLYNDTGSPVTGITIPNYNGQEGVTFTTDSNGQILIG